MKVTIEAYGKNIEEVLTSLEEAKNRVEDGIYFYDETNISSNEPEDLDDIIRKIETFGFKIRNSLFG